MAEEDGGEKPDIRDAEYDEIFGEAEPWSPVETKLVVGSLIAAFVALVVFGTLVNAYLLP